MFAPGDMVKVEGWDGIWFVIDRDDISSRVYGMQTYGQPIAVRTHRLKAPDTPISHQSAPDASGSTQGGPPVC